MLHRAFPWYWPVHPDSYGFAFYAFYALHMPCIAFCLAVPKMLFREHLCARFWHRLGLQSCWGSGVSQPSHTVLHRAFPWYWPVHPDSYDYGFACYAFYALHCLLFSSSEDAISTASLRTLLAPPWASILQGIRCFATIPHRAPQGFSMVLAGPSRQLWLCLLCLLCLAYAFCLAVPKMLFRQHLCARFWHRLGLQSCWGSGVSQPCPTVLHRAFPWYWPVHPDSYGFAFYAFYALHMPCVAFSLAVPKMLFRAHLCARFWHRLGLQSCWGSGVSQPCPTVLHRAFPWYWPVHPDSYGFAFYAFYALHMPCIAFCLAVPKMLFREHLCARFWHRLGLQSCWGSGVSQPCLKNPQGSVPKTLCLGISICLCLFNICILLLLLKVDGSQISSICLHAAQVTSRHLFRLLTVNRQDAILAKNDKKHVSAQVHSTFLSLGNSWEDESLLKFVISVCMCVLVSTHPLSNTVQSSVRIHL